MILEKICPLCNALESISEVCPYCNNLLKDGGPLENYYGSYGPYMDVLSLQNFLPDCQCVHVLYCLECYYDTRVAWELMNIN